MTRLETYGVGGYDPKKPDGNVVSVEEIDSPLIEPDPQVVALKQARDLLSKATTLDDVKAALDVVIDGVAPEKAEEIAKDIAAISAEEGIKP